MPGGSLRDQINMFGPMSEEVTRNVTEQILEGLVFLHSKNIAHRDIKAANTLRDTSGNIKLADFGLSKQLQKISCDAGLKTTVGTAYWMAPEVIQRKGYGYNADLWSVGCTVVELLTTKPPYGHLGPAEASYQIGTSCQHPVYNLPSDSSQNLKNFLLVVFQHISANRTSAKDLLKHQFITSGSLQNETRTSEVCTQTDHSLIELAVEDRIDLLLVGKTGNGLSSTGNTILGKVCFKTSHGSLSETQDIASAISEYKNRIIRIFDGPGVYSNNLFDCYFSDEIGIAMLIKKMHDALQLNPDGFHAFLLVLKITFRFTKEDYQCIKILKNIFGDNFLRNHCILIFTCGDMFNLNYHISFEQYCKEQYVHFQEVYQECEKRAVLFDNKSKDEHIREKQMSLLFKIVDQMQKNGRRYTIYDLEFAKINRHNFLDEMGPDKNALKIMLEMFEYFRLKKIYKDSYDRKLEKLNKLIIETVGLENETNHRYCYIINDVECFLRSQIRDLKDPLALEKVSSMLEDAKRHISESA